jgi:methylated-DNA-[protein]-cysteine S-methyltransferase
LDLVTDVASVGMQSFVGPLFIVASSVGVTSIEFAGGRAKARAAAGSYPVAKGHAEAAARQLGEYFESRRRTFDLALDLQGTAFQMLAWQALLRIPFGTTVTYGEQAAMIGRPTAARAVGSANGANPIPIVVPCHRVLAVGPALGGYSLGLDVKRALLALEGVSVAA